MRSECKESSQKPEVIRVEGNEKKISFTKNCKKATVESAKRTLKIAESTSETLEKNGSEIACLENNTTYQEKLISHVEEEVGLPNQELTNICEALSKNNPSSSKCTSAIATVSGKHYCWRCYCY